jgi:diguanylate cyclase (GGDEF)-like protein
MLRTRYTQHIQKASAMIQHLGRAVRGSRAFFILRDRTEPGEPHVLACHPPLPEAALLRALDADTIVCSTVSEDASHQAWVGIATNDSNESVELAREMTAVVAQSIASEIRLLSYQETPGTSRDAGTGMLDRDAFDVHVERAVERLSGNTGNEVAVLIADIDRCQRIAARFGDSGEQEAIRVVASRLQNALDNDVLALARIGNDRFGILIYDECAEASGLAMSTRIHECLAAPVQVADEEIFVTASIGVAVGAPGMTPSTLIQHADLAITELLSRGGRGSLVFRQGMQNLPALQLLRERDVRRAVTRGEFVVHFQPIVDAMRGGLHAFEALLRWRNPDEGLLPPSTFLDVLHETGLIVPVGQMVIHDSCKHAARWLALSGSLIPVSVNIVPGQLYADDFCQEIARTLDETGLPPQGLVLELTEDTLVHDAAHAQRVLERLHALGVCVMIDDFGTGYSSLSYLHDLPVSGIKLDRTFFRAIDTSDNQREIVRTIVRLAHFMGMLVVAEGIETDTQWGAIRDLECDLAQGFCFAHPFDAEHATKFLARAMARGEAA